MALYIFNENSPKSILLFPKMSANEASSAKGIIRIVFAKNPPDAFTTCNTFPTMVPSVDCPFPGWLVEVVKMLADYLNLHIDPIIVSSVIGAVNWGHRVENGTLGNAPPLHHHHHHPKHNWTGILGILEEEGMADTICTLYPYTDEKAEFFSFSHPVTGVRDIYIAKPKRKSLSMAVWNAFFPYEPKLWALLLLSLAIQCGFASLIANLEFRLNLRPNYNPLEKMWQYLRLQIHQATEFQTPFLLQSGNLAFLFYALIQATLFTQLYTAVLLSALIRGENPHPWESYNEMIRLIKSREYSLIMDKHHLEKDNSFYETLTFTGMSHLRNLANAIELNPIRKVDNVSQALDMVERGGFIYPTKQNSLAYQQSKERCDLFYFEDDHNQLPAFFIFSRHSKLLRDWNRAIQNNQAFIRRTYEKYFFHDFNTGNIPNCKRAAAPSPASDDEEGDGNLRNNALDASRSLDIVSTFGIFLIAMIGFALAFLVFLCELLIHAKARRLRRKWRTRRALVLANPSWPTHLMAIANEMRAKRMAHADSQQSSDGPATAKELFMIPSALLYTNPGPPQLDRNVGQSWWRPKTRRIRPPCADFHRQRSIISAVTLAAISMQNQQQNGEMELRQRQNGKNEGNWAVLEGEENGGEGKWARTAF